MSDPWKDEFGRRMQQFGNHQEHDGDGQAVSVKVRVASGCFHREHSPNAYQSIDEYLRLHAPDDAPCSFEEHESGPEILVYLALTTAGVSLTAGIINLVTAIIKARSDGIKKGDRPDAPLEIIVRGHHQDGEYFEETILRVDSRSPLAHDVIERAFKKPLKAIEEKKAAPAKPNKPTGQTKKNRKKK